VSEKPVRIETFMGEGTDQVMFTLVYADGYRRAYWLPFWKAIWHVCVLLWRGVDVQDKTP